MRDQSLAKGAAGIALPYIERARSGLTTWHIAHAWLTAAASTGVSAADDAGLFYGAPALAFALHAAGPGKYGKALALLDGHVRALTHRRVDQAMERIRAGLLPQLAEFDLIYGLTGIGAYLLQRTPGSDTLEAVLTYLVRLTEPVLVDGERLPGWWTDHDPFFGQSAGFAGGHGNVGIAHGITGPLALLALALRRGIGVTGQADAIGRICSWLDAWRHDHDSGPWWPQWITLDELRTGRSAQPGPIRPSWCYGTPGVARAQQLASLATGDTGRREMAERALSGCLADPIQLGRIIDPSLCHGWAGLYQTAWRASRDAISPEVGVCLPYLADRLIEHGDGGDATGLLEGDAGLALALHTAEQNTPPITGWDSCLLIN